MRVFGRSVVALLALCLLAVVVASCGGGGSSSSATSDQSSTSPESTPTTSEEGAGGAASGLTAEIEKLEQRPTSIGITEPIKGKVPSSYKIEYLQCPVPTCAQIGEYLEEAASHLGWTVEKIPNDGTPEKFKAGWEEAIRRNPDAIVTTSGPELSTVEEQVKEAESKKIAMVGISAIEATGGPYIATIGSAEGWGVQAGESIATYVGGKVGEGKVLLLTLPGIEITKVNAKAFEDALSKTCPKCDVQRLEIPVTALSEAGQRVASTVQANPDISFVYSTFTLPEGMAAAYAGSGITEPPPMATVSPGESELKPLQNGEAGFEVSVGFPNVESAWRALDALQRNVTGQDPSVDSDKTLPRWLITTGNVPPEVPLPMVKDYEQQFLKLWNLK